MNTAADLMFDTDPGSFEQDVIVASQDHLVMVDFWADWCGPCKNLAPILEKLVAHYGGAVKLAKVNTDQHQALAAQFGIRSLPTVFLFHLGQPVDQFMGVQPESVIRDLIEKFITGPSESELDQAIGLHENGEVDAAVAELSRLIETQPENDQARTVLMQWLLALDRVEDVRVLADGMSQEGKTNPEFRSILARLDFAGKSEEGPEIGELEAAIEQDGNDLEARFQLASKLIMAERIEEALEQLLAIVRKDRTFRDNEPSQTMLKVFEMCGGKGDLVLRYRRMLSSALN